MNLKAKSSLAFWIMHKNFLHLFIPSKAILATAARSVDGIVTKGVHRKLIHVRLGLGNSGQALAFAV